MCMHHVARRGHGGCATVVLSAFFFVLNLSTKANLWLVKLSLVLGPHRRMRRSIAPSSSVRLLLFVDPSHSSTEALNLHHPAQNFY